MHAAASEPAFAYRPQLPVRCNPSPTETAKSQANALRRRIDFVVPIGPDPGRQAQPEAGDETVSV